MTYQIVLMYVVNVSFSVVFPDLDILRFLYDTTSTLDHGYCMQAPLVASLLYSTSYTLIIMVHHLDPTLSTGFKVIFLEDGEDVKLCVPQQFSMFLPYTKGKRVCHLYPSQIFRPPLISHRGTHQQEKIRWK